MLYFADSLSSQTEIVIILLSSFAYQPMELDEESELNSDVLLCLPHNLRSYWATNVPRVFRPGVTNQNTQTFGADDELAEQVLFGPLERALISEYEEELISLSAERVGGICGIVFKSGEATYSCRECASDPTCVMCFQCFSNSAHRNHKYRMATSKGSGYCDCGDLEAWKTAAHCDRHSPTASSTSETVQLPAEASAHLRQVTLSIVEYCTRALCWDYSDILPAGLDNGCSENDCWQTMLFNDEAHTYEDVIKALVKALNCTEPAAMYYASVVDREGRSNVLSGTKEACEKAADIIKKTSKNNKAALIVEVMDSRIVAHQLFAIRLIHWLLEKIQKYQCLLPIVCEVFCSSGFFPCAPKESLLLHAMFDDARIWKSARAAFHQLIMGTVLMHPEYKKSFSLLLAEHYARLMKQFVDDDHDHTLSVVSLTVQTFTVPTIARMLIAQANVITTIVQTLLDRCAAFVDANNGVLCFERSRIPVGFKRSLFIIADLQYILIAIPTPAENSVELRRNFLLGFRSILKFLSLMQGMNAAARQTGQHQEYEPEWETAFNLQLRLCTVLQLLLEWCSLDKDTLLQAIALCVEHLQPALQSASIHYIKVSNLASACVNYDVSKEPVSIHLPISRLLAGLMVRLGKYGISFTEAFDFAYPVKIRASTEKLIDLPLRVLAMVSQSQAGMWRRNGYALLNQIHNYYAPLCRAEMYDRDILQLQIGAAMLESDCFLIQLIDKFGLKHWIQTDYEISKPEEDFAKQTIVLVEELLHLLIIITAERFSAGVGENVTREDTVRRDVIHLLCKGSSTFSQLDKCLSEDACEKTGLESVIRSVATIRTPTAGTAAKFELKPELREQYSPFFYHYSRTEQSKAEMTQKRERKDCQQLALVACAPLILPPFTANFAKVVRLLNCDVTLHLLTIVLERAVAKARTFSENQLHRALYLVGVALNEEIAQAAAATPRGVAASQLFVFSTRSVSWRSPKPGILELLEQLSAAPQAETYRDLMNWTILRFKECLALQSKTSVSESSNSVSPGGEANKMSAKEGSPGQNEKEKRQLRTALADKRRKKVMEHMNRLQKSFVKKHTSELECSEMELDADGDVEWAEQSPPEDPHASFPVCVGTPWAQAASSGLSDPTSLPIGKKVTCVLCQESQTVSLTGRCVILAAFVQNSTLFRKMRDEHSVEAVSGRSSLLLPAHLPKAAYLSTCSHVMHWDCWNTYFDTVMAKEQRRPLLRIRPLVFDVDFGEFLCPLPHGDVAKPYSDWLRELRSGISEPSSALSSELNLRLLKPIDGQQKQREQEAKKEKSERLIESLVCSLIGIDEGSLPRGSVLSHFVPSSQSSPHSIEFDRIASAMSDSNVDMLTRLCGSIYQNFYRTELKPSSAKLAPHGEKTPHMLWMTTAYTLRCLEAVLNYENKPLFGAFSSRQKDCFYGLLRCAALGGLVIFGRHCLEESCAELLRWLLCIGDDMPERSIIEVDVFTVLVELCLSFGWLSQRSSDADCRLIVSGANERGLLLLCTSAHLVQLVLSFRDDASLNENGQSSMECDNEVEVPVEEGSHAPSVEFFSWVWSHVETGYQPKTPTKTKLLAYLKQGLLPFLRQSALFFHGLSQVPPPEALRDSSFDQFVALCRYLALPCDIDSLVAEIDKDLATKWLEGCDSYMRNGGKLTRQPVELNRLQDLPLDYSLLINKAGSFSCPSLAVDDSRMPTMCLICGEVLCSQSYCCQKTLDGVPCGACTHHAAHCNNDVGMFLRIRDCQLVLLCYRTRGCFMAAPYIDEYGETDQLLRRGNPLFLSSELFTRLQNLWINHGIQEEVVSRLEYQPSLLNMEWLHL